MKSRWFNHHVCEKDKKGRDKMQYARMLGRCDFPGFSDITGNPVQRSFPKKRRTLKASWYRGS
jgi:hypothetical protein